MSNIQKNRPFIKDSMKLSSLEVESDPTMNKQYDDTRDARDIFQSVLASKVIVKKIKNGIGFIAELLPVIGAIIFSISGFDMIQAYFGNFGIKDNAITLVLTTALLLAFAVMMFFVGLYARKAIEYFYELVITWGGAFGIIMSILSVAVTSIIFVLLITDILNSFIGWSLVIMVAIMVFFGVIYDALNHTKNTVIILFTALASFFSVAIAQIDVYLDGYRGASIIAYEDEKKMNNDPLLITFKSNISNSQAEIARMNDDIEHQRYRQSLGVSNDYNALLMQKQNLQKSIDNNTMLLVNTSSSLKSESEKKQENFVMGIKGISYIVMMFFGIIVLLSHLINYIYLNRGIMARLKEDSEAKEKEEAQRLLDKESTSKVEKNQSINSQDDVEEKNQAPLETTQEDWYMMEQVLKYAHSRDENKKWVTIGGKEFLIKPSAGELALFIKDKNGENYSVSTIQRTLNLLNESNQLRIFNSKIKNQPSYFLDISR